MIADELRGLAIVSVTQAQKLGAIDDILIDTQQHQVAGFLLQGGLFHGGPAVAWSDVRTIGIDAVMVDDSSAAGANVAGQTRLAQLRGRKVVSNTGELVGTIVSIDFDPVSGAIVSYIVAGLDRGVFRAPSQFNVPAATVSAIGADLITIDAQAAGLKAAQ